MSTGLQNIFKKEQCFPSAGGDCVGLWGVKPKKHPGQVPQKDRDVRNVDI